jgi:hypothetical protein
MEASANTENKENVKQEIKVEDYFVDQQNSNPQENPQHDNETAQKETSNEDADNINKIEGEVKIRKLNFFLMNHGYQNLFFSFNNNDLILLK